MDRRRLQLFLAVAEEGNVLRAASRQNIAQSALSRQIHALEQDLGILLFERLPKGVRLTNAGEIYRREAVKILKSFEHAQKLVVEADSGSVGSIVIGANEISIRDDHVLRIVDYFRNRFPALQPQLRLSKSHAQIEKVWKREIDIGFLYGLPDDESVLAHHPVRRGIYELLLPAGHPLDRLEQIRLADLVGYPFISMTQDPNHASYWEKIFAQLVRRGFTPKTSSEANTAHEMDGLVAAGDGVAFLYDSYRANLASRVVMRPVVDFQVCYTLSAVWRKDNRSPLLTHLVDTVLAFCPSLASGLSPVSRPAKRLLSKAGIPMRET